MPKIYGVLALEPILHSVISSMLPSCMMDNIRRRKAGLELLVVCAKTNSLSARKDVSGSGICSWAYAASYLFIGVAVMVM